MKAAPLLFGLLALLGWEAAVRISGIPPYILPGPAAILRAFLADPALLLGSLLSTLAVTGVALLASCLLGGLMAGLMAASVWARAAILPWAVVLQVTPIVAIAPLIIVWVGDPFASLVVCATIVAFFPVFSNTAAGLASAPPELLDLFRLNGAGRWQTLWLLRLPAALPMFLAGLRVSGGLALVGAVVAEFVAGSGGFASGLAYRILEAGYRLQIPRMFAALVLLSAAGIAINLGLGALSAWLLRRRGEA
jgi:NitT/TauT family transport system permease protein